MNPVRVDGSGVDTCGRDETETVIIWQRHPLLMLTK